MNPFALPRTPRPDYREWAALHARHAVSCYDWYDDRTLGALRAAERAAYRTVRRLGFTPAGFCHEAVAAANAAADRFMQGRAIGEDADVKVTRLREDRACTDNPTRKELEHFREDSRDIEENLP